MPRAPSQAMLDHVACDLEFTKDEKMQLKKDVRHVAKQVLLAERLFEAGVRGIQRLKVGKVWPTTKSYSMGLFRSADDLHRLQKRVGRAKRRRDLKAEVGRELQPQVELEKQRMESARTAEANAPKTRSKSFEIDPAKREGLWVKEVTKVADKTISVHDAYNIFTTYKLRLTKVDINRNVAHIRAGRDMEPYSSLYERRGRRPTRDAALAAKAREPSPAAAARARARALHHLSLALASLREACALDAAAQTQNVIDACESHGQ